MYATSLEQNGEPEHHLDFDRVNNGDRISTGYDIILKVVICTSRCFEVYHIPIPQHRENTGIQRIRISNRLMVADGLP